MKTALVSCAVAALVVGTVRAQESAQPAATERVEFEVSSIKRSTTNPFAGGRPPNPASGQVSISNPPIQTLILRAFPLETMPALVIGLPDWAQSERYDVVAKSKPGASSGEQQ